MANTSLEIKISKLTDSVDELVRILEDGAKEKGKGDKPTTSKEKELKTLPNLNLENKINKYIGDIAGRFYEKFPIAKTVVMITNTIGEFAKNIATADQKLQEIQNAKNTALTNRNITLGNIETEGIVDAITTFGENAISQYNILFTKVAGNLQLETTKAIAGIGVVAESAIGNANKAAWKAFESQIDITKQEKNLEADIAKTTAIEERNIGQRETEKSYRNVERNFETQQAKLAADIEVSRLNQTANEFAQANPYSTVIANTAGNGIKEDNVFGKEKYRSQSPNELMGDNIYGYGTAGIAGDIAGRFGITAVNDISSAALTKQTTSMEKQITNMQNSLNAQQAAAKNTIDTNKQVLSTSNQIANTVQEGTTEIVKMGNEVSAQLQKAWGNMAQAIEEYYMKFQKQAFDNGVGKNITTRGDLDTYFKSLMRISSGLMREYGLTSEQILDMQTNYNANGRSKLFSRNDYRSNSALTRLLGGDAKTATEIADNTEIFNMGISGTVSLVDEMYKQVTKMGLDGRKYMKDLTKNLKLAQKYDFRDGVKGLMRMAKDAQKIAFNIDNLSSILDDIQDGGLENILTKGASLQVLGGNFAMGADPIAMMFEAFNDPESLMHRYNSMLNGIGFLNSKTGKVDFTGEQQMMMRNFAKLTNQSIEDVRAQATYKVKKDKLEGLINPNMGFTEDERVALVNKAYKGEDGRWKVNDIRGNEIDLTNVNKSNIKDIQPSTYEETMTESMKHVVSFTDLFAGQTESNLATLSDEMDKNNNLQNNFYERLDKQYEDLQKNMSTYVEKMTVAVESATESYGKMLDNFMENDPMKHVSEAIEGAKEQLQDFAGRTELQLNQILDHFHIEHGDMNFVEQLQQRSLSLGAGGQNIPLAQLVRERLISRDGENMIVNKSGIEKIYGTLSGAKGMGKHTVNKLKEMGIKNIDFKDGILTGNGSPMFTQASSVTPIHDGAVQIAESDPQDTAIFAKNGGPFDTLFNGVFDKVDAMYDAFSGGTKVGFETIKVELNGKLELSNGNGQNVDIINELQNNPMLLRALSRMLTEQLSNAMNGGRGSLPLSISNV